MSDKFTKHEWLDMFPALESTPRLNILILLNNEGAKSMEQISERLELGKITQRWIDGYINPLLTRRLIDYADRPYYKLFEITQKARDVLEIILVTKGR